VGKNFIQKKFTPSNYQLFIIIVAGIVASTICYLLLYVYTEQLQGLPDIGNTFIVRSTVYQLLDLLHKIGLASAYASILFLLSRKFSLTALANLGRMSLTNYISQALIIVPFCLLFNMFDHFTPTLSLALFIVMWTVQVLFSSWWLSRHKFGPMEWLLRRFTYGKLTSAKKEEEETIEFVPRNMART
jgi:hypothetical protein